MPWRRVRRASLRVLTFSLIAVYVAVVSMPFYYMGLTSLRSSRDVYRKSAMLWPDNLTLDNYFQVFSNSRMTSWLQNSLMVALLSTTVSVSIGILAAYSLARLRFRGSDTIARSVLFMYLLPGSLLFIPLFLLISSTSLINSIWALVLAYQAFNVPFCTWMLLGYFRSLPRDLEDAALIDGCGRFGVLWRIVLPLAAPGIVTAFIFGFTNSWNEFLFAAVLVQRTELRTIPVGLYSFQRGDVLLWGQLMAAAIVATVPVLVLFTFVQRYMVQGLTGGSVKG